MNRITMLLVVLGMMTSANAADPLRYEDIVGTVFESVSAEGTNVVLKFNLSGRRFKYSINETSSRINVYGEELRVPIGSRLRIVDRGTEMVFASLPPVIKDMGFRVYMIEGYCTGGKTRRKKEGYLVFQDRLKGGRPVPGKARTGRVVITEASVDAVTTLMTNNAGDGIGKYGSDQK